MAAGPSRDSARFAWGPSTTPADDRARRSRCAGDGTGSPDAPAAAAPDQRRGERPVHRGHAIEHAPGEPLHCTWRQFGTEWQWSACHQVAIGTDAVPLKPPTLPKYQRQVAEHPGDGAPPFPQPSLPHDDYELRRFIEYEERQQQKPGASGVDLEQEQPAIADQEVDAPAGVAAELPDREPLSALTVKAARRRHGDQRAPERPRAHAVFVVLEIDEEGLVEQRVGRKPRPVNQEAAGHQ